MYKTNYVTLIIALTLLISSPPKAQVTQEWVARYNGPENSTDVANSIAVDVSGNVYVTDYSNGSGTAVDYATIKYSQLVGFQPISSEIPDMFSLSQNYPNPFNPSTNINFSIPKSSFVTLKVFNIMGKEISSLVNENLNPGVYSFDFNAEDLASGVYFYKLTAGEFSEVKKMTMIK